MGQWVAVHSDIVPSDTVWSEDLLHSVTDADVPRGPAHTVRRPRFVWHFALALGLREHESFGSYGGQQRRRPERMQCRCCHARDGTVLVNPLSAVIVNRKHLVTRCDKKL